MSFKIPEVCNFVREENEWGEKVNECEEKMEQIRTVMEEMGSHAMTIRYQINALGASDEELEKIKLLRESLENSKQAWIEKNKEYKKTKNELKLAWFMLKNVYGLGS